MPGIEFAASHGHFVTMPEFVRQVPEGDNRERNVCRDCGYVAYENPKIIVGSVVAHEGRILLCRRAIEPRRDYWTLPAGYMELGETLQAGAMREAQEEAEADREISEAMKALFSERFGIDFDPAVDVSTQAKFQAYVAQQMAQQQDRQAQEEAQATERSAKRKKSPKQQAAEDQKQAEEKNITKSVRALYMDLVKALHPDREPDEAEKLRKTELLKQVTTAYQANELLTLLRLQLELQRIDQSHLENLAEDQLRYYNKLLKEQARELDEALYREQMDWSSFTGKPYFFTSTPAAMEYDYQSQFQMLNLKIRSLEAEVLAFGHDPAALKMFLKTYRITKPGTGPLFG